MKSYEMSGYLTGFVRPSLLEEKVLYRTLKATYLEPLKGSIHS